MSRHTMTISRSMVLALALTLPGQAPAQAQPANLPVAQTVSQKVVQTQTQAVTDKKSAWPVQEMVGPFHFHSEQSITDLSTLADEVRALPQWIHAKTGIEPCTEKVHIVLMRTEAEYRRYMGHYFPKIPTRRALFIKDRGPGLVFTFRNRELAIDLRHECTHALLQDKLQGLPLWLDEGLAEYFEVASVDRGYHPTHLPSTQWQTKMGMVPSLEKLESYRETNQMGVDQYRDAWSWVHFLLEGPDSGKTLLRGYLSDISHGVSAGQLSHRVRLNLPSVRDAFLQHFDQFEIPQASEVSLAETSSPSIK